MHAARLKNPLCRPGNLCLSEHDDGEAWGQASDEYCHSHSEQLRNSRQILEKGQEAKFAILEFAKFVHCIDSDVLPALEAMYASATQAEACALLHMTEYRFLLSCDRLRELARCFAGSDSRRE
jgi:hypothetical protein